MVRLIHFAASVICIAEFGWCHGGSVDGQGGHNYRLSGKDHFHGGSFERQIFDSMEEATATAYSLNNGGINQVSANLPTDLTSYMPAHEPGTSIVVHQAYSLAYSEDHEQATWVLYRITVEQFSKWVDRTDDFRPDPLVNSGSATLSDYKESGYDRGHLAPAAAMAWSKEVMSESFLLSNISPQIPAFNRGIWRELEQEIRVFAKLHKDIVVVTGPVLTEHLPQIGPSSVSVPGYYYKVVLDHKPPKFAGIGFLLAHQGSQDPLSTFAVPIDSVEVFTGHDFFPFLPDSLEHKIESNLILDHWFPNFSGGSSPIEKASWGQIKDR